MFSSIPTVEKSVDLSSLKQFGHSDGPRADKNNDENKGDDDNQNNFL